MKCVLVDLGLAVLLAGCAQPKQTTAFPPVPGPSQPKVSLPPPEPAPVAIAASTNKPPAKKTAPPRAKPPEITASEIQTGKVIKFVEKGRFVVLEFPLTQMPANGKRLFIYRNDLKVGEIQITGPRRDEHTVGDLLQGEAQPGDVVRDH